MSTFPIFTFFTFLNAYLMIILRIYSVLLNRMFESKHHHSIPNIKVREFCLVDCCELYIEVVYHVEEVLSFA